MSVDGLKPHLRRGMTIIEAALASLVIGVAIVAAINVVGATATIQTRASMHAVARHLAMSLLNDIVCLPYEDPDVATLALGRDAGETNSRVVFDDVDDFNDWNEAPPLDRSGTPLAQTANWSRSVKVEWVNPLNLSQAQGTETSVKRITVTVKYRNTPLLTRSAIRTRQV